MSDTHEPAWFDSMNALTDDITASVDGKHLSYWQLAEKLTELGWRKEAPLPLSDDSSGASSPCSP
jgi:hypothetical protein